MANSDKIFRDPLYNYIAVDDRDRWLIGLIDTPEVQRLRRIHQLGVSHFTYTGADHSRLSHTLGVLHLMQHACARMEKLPKDGPAVDLARPVLLAAAILHDVGHGPFSHLFEPALEIDHEDWSCQIINCPDTAVNQELVKYDIPIDQVTALIEKDNHQRPVWQKTLLSSELDVDRLDYLRRDSYFTGSGYGHFDWYRILSSFDLHTTDDGLKILVWPESAIYSIEEYIFSRFYMYNNVYQHKTTRGFEKLVQAAWKRAKQIDDRGKDATLVPEIAEFLHAQEPTISQYLAMEDATLLYQMHVWTSHSDKVLSDLSRRFLQRDRLAAIEDPVTESAFVDARNDWEQQIGENVAAAGFDPDYYVLRDDLKLTVYNPYMPEKEDPEQDPYNAVFVRDSTNDKPREISTVLERLGSVTGAREKRFRYYVPRECRDAVEALAKSKTW